ncbi:MAG: hypothetical protein HY854_00985 [Burkholderiales bacterium]|nr:hypothetical protein [Burkholderiales bacterium]
MAITATERADIIELVALMFDAAPGAIYLADIVAAYEATGHNLQQLARLLQGTPAFQALHPNFQTGDEFATDFLSIVGLEGDAEARDWVLSQHNAGASKAEIMFAAWQVLENLAPTAAPQYQAARDLLLNKAEVAEYYSVTVGGRSTDAGELQALLNGVTADGASVASAIGRIDAGLAIGPQLTQGQDHIVVPGQQHSVVTGLIDGDADFNTSASTYTAGDRITGNGRTDLKLFVVEAGNAQFAQLANIANVNIFAATQGAVRINAAGWQGVGHAALNDGIGGLDVFLDHLRPGTGISVSEVRGSISAEYERGKSGDLFAMLRNKDRGGEGASLALDAQGNVQVQLADSASATITADNGLMLGNVTVSGGDDAWFGFGIDAGGDVTIGDITVSLGNDSSAMVDIDGVEGDLVLGRVSLVAASGARVAVSGVTGDATIGDVQLAVADEAAASLSVDDIDGDLSMGDVSLEGGAEAALAVRISNVADGVFGDVTLAALDSADLDVAMSDAARLSVGDITLTAGDGSDLDVAIAGADAADIAGITLVAGDSSDLDLSVSGVGEAAIGGIRMVAGAASSVNAAFVGEDGMLMLGDAELAAGDSSTASVSVDAFGSLSAGALMIAAGDESTVTFSASGVDSVDIDGATLAGGDASDAAFTIAGASQVALGDVAATVGARGTALVSVAVAGGAGTVAAGKLAAHAGDGGTATVAITHFAVTATSEAETGPTLGDLSIGDITVSAGSAGSIEEEVAATAFVLYGGAAGDVTAGNFTIGNIDVSMGNGFVSGTMESRAQATVAAGAIVNGTMGDVTIGDVSLAGGDFAVLNALAGGAVVDGGALGNGWVGDVSLFGGEALQVNAGLYWIAAGGTPVVGNFDVDTIEVFAAQDARVAIDMMHGGVDTTLNEMGDLGVGGIQAVLGDNSRIAVRMRSGGEFEGLDTDSAGDFLVGDIDIAVSATTIEDLSGGSVIEVSLAKVDRNIATGGDFTIGDVRLAGGDSAVIDLDILYSGTFEQMGDVSIGTVELHAGVDATQVEATITIVNAHEDGVVGDFRLDGVVVSLGDDSAAAVNVALGGRTFGDITLGGIDLQLGAGSTAGVNLLLGSGTPEEVGTYTIGDVAIVLGENASAAIDSLDLVVSGDAGGLAVGSFTAQVGEGASAAFDLTVAAGGDIGSVAMGNVTLDVGENATARQSLTLAAGGELGAMVMGSIAIDVAAGGLAQWVGFSVEAGDIEGITVGDVTVKVTDGALANIHLHAYASDGAGKMAIGNVSLSVADIAEAEAPVGGSVLLDVSHAGDVTIGNLDVAVAGTADTHEVAIRIATEGDLVIGDIVVAGKGQFILDGADHAAEDNTSYLALDIGGKVTVGNVDCSGYAGDAVIDLRFSDAGAGRITGGAGDDMIWGNEGANIITGGKGVDLVDISQGGNDTIVTNKGDSGKTAGAFDVVTGFTAGDKLDFNLAAGSAGNYVERDQDFTSLADFLRNAADALNSTVKYFVQDDGADTYVAVNFGSGEADLVIVLAGVSDATSLQFSDFVA